MVPATQTQSHDNRLWPEKEMATHSSTLAWKRPWTEEPGRLQSVESRRVGHDWATSLSLFTFMHWRRKWQPTPVFLPGESQGWGACWAAIYRVAQSRTQLKWLRSSSSFDTSCLFALYIYFQVKKCLSNMALHLPLVTPSSLFLTHGEKSLGISH